MRNRRSSASDGAIDRMIAQTRDVVRRTAQMLAQPRPDTFLGRKTHQPISCEEGPENSPEIVPQSQGRRRHDR
jgi:hypothetical protein